MKLIEVSNWKAVHFQDRTILRSDWPMFNSSTWDDLIRNVEVEPMEEKGHYKVI